MRTRETRLGLAGWRLLFVTPEYFHTANAEAIMNRKLVSALRRHGAATDVVAQLDHHRTGIELSCSTDRATPAPGERLSEKLGRLLGEARRLAGQPLGSRLFDLRTHFNQTFWALSASRQARRLLQRNRHHVLLSTTAYGHLAAWQIRRKHGVPWVACWNDPFPDVKYPPPYGRGNDAEIPARHALLLQRVSDAACWHTFPAARLRRYMLEYLPSQVRNRSSVIPHLFVDQAETAPLPGGTALLLCHAGDLHKQRRPQSFLEALARFRADPRSGGAVRFRLVGKDQAGLAQQAVNMGLHDIIEYSDWGSYEESLTAMRASHVLVLIEAPLEEGIFLPSKLTDYVHAGRAVLAVSPRNGTLADLFRAHGGGVAADCTDPDAIYRALLALHASWANGTLAEDYSPARLRAQFSDAAVIPQYGALFERLVPNP